MLVMGGRGQTGYVLGQGRGGASNGLLTGLVAYWPLSEASGNAIDAHSNGLTLTAQNAPGADTGQVYASARTFNGSNQYFSRASEAALQPGGVDFAIAAWVYLVSKVAPRPILSKCNTASTATWEYDLTYYNVTDRFWFRISNGSALFTATANNYGSPPTGEFALICAWNDSASKKIYISMDNGTPDEATYTGTIPTTTQPLLVGTLFTFWHSGRIGPVAMWKNRTLSAADRTALWNGGAGLAYASFTA